MRQCSWQTYVISHVIRVQKASPVLVNTLASVNGPINSYTSCAQKRNTFLQSFARDLYAKPVSSERTLIVYAEPLHSLLNACVLPNRNGKVAQARVGSTATYNHKYARRCRSVYPSLRMRGDGYQLRPQNVSAV